MAEEDYSRTIKIFTRRALLYEILNEFKGHKMEEKFSLFEDRLVQLTNCPDNEKHKIVHALKHFKSEFKKKWIGASYKEKRFLKSNEVWLTSSMELPNWPEITLPKPGRPKKTFEDVCDRSKRRKTKDLREQVSVEELTYAAGVSQGTSGNKDASKIIKELMASPTRATKLRKVISTTKKQTAVKKYTPAEALAIFVEGDFTRRQWEIIHRSGKAIYPCYSFIQMAKMECYPEEESIHVTETSAEVKLQALLNHTALRLYKYIAEVVNTSCTEEEKQNMVLISKWGCDGSQQTQYKQKFENHGDSDANIFQSSLVPLRLSVIIEEEEKKVIWQNPVPSSVRFCRPIRIRFINETKDITKQEIQYCRKCRKNNKASSLESSIFSIRQSFSLHSV